MEQIFIFLTEPGNAERVLGLVTAIIIVLGIISILIYHILVIIFDFLKTFISIFKINRKERIVEVPKYVIPPENKEINKYLTIFKKIADEYNNNIKL